MPPEWAAAYVFRDPQFTRQWNGPWGHRGPHGHHHSSECTESVPSRTSLFVVTFLLWYFWSSSQTLSLSSQGCMALPSLQKCWYKGFMRSKEIPLTFCWELFLCRFQLISLLLLKTWLLNPTLDSVLNWKKTHEWSIAGMEDTGLCWNLFQEMNLFFARLRLDSMLSLGVRIIPTSFKWDKIQF